MRLSLIALAFAAIAFPLFAQGDPASMLEELGRLKKSAAEHAERRLSSTYKTLRDASASGGAALALFEEAIKATQFDAQGKDNAFRDWKKGPGAKFSSRESQEAIRMHLVFLLVALAYAEGTAKEAVAEELYQYTRTLRDKLDMIGGEEIVRRPVTDGVFARWLGLCPSLRKIQNWELTPGNLDGIASRNLLPMLRELEDPRLITYWDERIAWETARASGRGGFESAQFTSIRRPALLWSRAEDLLALRQRDKAIQEMFAAIKLNPEHPDAAGWFGKLESLLKTPPTP